MNIKRQAIYDKLHILYEEYKLIDKVKPKWDLEQILERKKEIVLKIIECNIKIIELWKNVTKK